MNVDNNKQLCGSKNSCNTTSSREIDRIDFKKDGWLVKETKRIFGKNLKPFWFEVDACNECLYYYTGPPANGTRRSKLKGKIPLGNATIESSKDCTLVVKLKKRTVLLHAKSDDERDGWIKAIEIAKKLSVAPKVIMEEWKNSADSPLVDFVTAACDVDTSTTDEDRGEDDLSDTEEEEEQEDLTELFETKLEDKDGYMIPLKDILGDNVPTLVVLLRHFGCMLCRVTAGLILLHKNRFTELGIPIIAVGLGTPVMAKSFAKEVGFPGRLYTDPSAQVYKLLSCKRGMRYVLSMKVAEKIKAAYGAGFRQGPISGDIFQIGGAFVISKKGGVLYEHRDSYAGDSLDFDNVINGAKRYLQEHPEEDWSGLASVKREWSEVLPLNKDDTLVKSTDPGFNVETGRNNVVYSKPKLNVEEMDLDAYFYRDNFVGKEHVNFTGDLGDGNNPFIASIEKAPGMECKAIVRTKKGETRLIIPVESCTSSKDMIQFIKGMIPSMASAKFHKVRKPCIVEQLVQMEKAVKVTKYKFGVLYCGPGQKDEIQMYNNENPPPSFYEFLSYLGDKITLKDWPNYAGGLDVSANFTGKEAVYTKFKGFEVIFHVAPMIPCEEGSDEQKVERKKFVGNDVVVVIFKEGNQPIDPATFKSHFNHVFVVVQKEGNQYRVAVANKPGVPPTGPYLPFPSVFKKDKYFHDFMLTKLISSERAALHTAQFGHLIRTKKELLQTIIDESKDKTSCNEKLQGSSSDRSSDRDSRISDSSFDTTDGQRSRTASEVTPLTRSKSHN